MLRLAGEKADGTVLWMTGTATVRNHIAPTINAAAAAAGRPAPRIVCILPIAVSDDPNEARAVAAKAFNSYVTLPSYRAVLDREGAAEPADLAIVGNEKSVETQLDALADAGVTDFVAIEYTRDNARTRSFPKTLA
jgi:alkanesulfonate monooxygenase SsuD/methylene tetrahydromethanopterin reductase-like flavin-dependent oxidoreductase (luciferase family)